MQILIVDDSAMMRAMIKRVIGLAGVRVDGERYGLWAISSMEHDGEYLVALGLARRPGNTMGSIDGIATIEPASGRVVDFKILDFPVNGLALYAGGYLTADRDPERGSPCRSGRSRDTERNRVHFFRP